MKEVILTAFITTVITGILTGLVKSFLNRNKKLSVLVEKCFFGKNSIKLAIILYNDSLVPQVYSNLRIGCGEKRNIKTYCAETTSSERKTHIGEPLGFLVEAEVINSKDIKRLVLTCYNGKFIDTILWIVYIDKKGNEKKIKINKKNIKIEGVLRKQIDF